MTALDPALVHALGGADLSGKTVVVTGATTGMGLETARALASAGARTVVVGRGAERLAAARAAVESVASAPPVLTVELDLADLDSVARGAAAVTEQVDRIDVLVNNAGVMFTPLTRTAQGHELQFGVNHLGHFAFTTALRPLLGDGSRIVNLSSAGHALGAVDLTDVDWQQRDYDKFEAYGASKSANILFTVEADRRWRQEGVRSFAVHPGAVATELARYMEKGDFRTMVQLNAAAEQQRAAGASTPGAEATGPTAKQQLGSGVALSADAVGRKKRERMTFATPAEGATTAVWAAVSPELAGQGGLYLADRAISTDVKQWAVDADVASALWELSERLLHRANLQ